MDTFSSFAGYFLIAMPAMGDPHFTRGVTLVCQHTADGAIGLTVNRPSRFTLGEVLKQMDITCERPEITSQPVLQGGPVQPERGFVLHSGQPDWDASYAVGEHWSVTTSRDILVAMADGKGPHDAVVALGYAGWETEQLEREIRDNAWLTARADQSIVFRTPIDRRWNAAALLVGVNVAQLAGYAGHA